MVEHDGSPALEVGAEQGVDRGLGAYHFRGLAECRVARSVAGVAWIEISNRLQMHACLGTLNGVDTWSEQRTGEASGLNQSRPLSVPLWNPSPGRRVVGDHRSAHADQDIARAAA